MKRVINVLLVIALVFVSVVAIAACNPNEADTCADGQHVWDSGHKSYTDCTQAGKLVQTCKLCGKTRETDIPAGEHVWDVEHAIVTLQPTCTDTGKQTVSCSVCGKTEEQTLPSTGHVWGEIRETQAPTCGKPGIGSATCSVCGTPSDAVEIPATGLHSWDEGSVTTKPNCTDEGVRTFTCTVCKDTTTQSIPANGHFYGNLIAEKGATCKEDGMHAHYQCSECDKLFVDEDGAKKEVSAAELTISATGDHVWGAFKSNGDGTHAESCKVCGEIKPGGANEQCTPSEVGDVSHDSTHGLQEGWYADADYHWHVCTVCGGKIEPVKHTFPSNPDDNSTCTTCGHKFFEVQIFVGNDLENVAQLEPTIEAAFDWIAEQDASATYTIKLNHDRSNLQTDATIKFSDGRTVVIELGEYSVDFKGTLTIGSGSLTVNGSGTFAIGKISYSGGTLVLPAGTYNFEISGTSCTDAPISVGGNKLTHKWIAKEWHWAELYSGTGLPTVSVDLECGVCKTPENGISATAKEEGSRTSSNCVKAGEAQFSATAILDGQSFKTTANKTYQLPLGGHSYTQGKYQHVDGTWQHRQVCDVCGNATGTTNNCTDIKLNVCQDCKYQYTVKEIFKHIDDRKTLYGTYQFSGEVYKLDLDGVHHNIYFYVEFNGTRYQFEAADVNLNGHEVSELHIGSIVTVSGSGSNLQYFSGNGGVYEFYKKDSANNACTLDAIENPQCDVTVRDNSNSFEGISVKVTSESDEPLASQYAIGTLVKFKVAVTGGKLAGVKVNGELLTAQDGVYSFTVEGDVVIEVEVGDNTSPVEEGYIWEASESPETSDGQKWSKGNKYTTAKLGDIATATLTYTGSSTNTGKYNETDWRLYSSEKNAITIKPTSAEYILISISFTMNGSVGPLVIGETELGSETVYTFSEEERINGATFTVKDGQKAFITKIHIVYKLTTPHVFEQKSATSPTGCLTPGIKEHYECTAHDSCKGKYYDAEGNIMTDYEEPANGHKWKWLSKTGATCTESAYLGQWQCETCLRYSVGGGEDSQPGKDLTDDVTFEDRIVNSAENGGNPLGHKLSEDWKYDQANHNVHWKVCIRENCPDNTKGTHFEEKPHTFGYTYLDEGHHTVKCDCGLTFTETHDIGDTCKCKQSMFKLSGAGIEKTGVDTFAEVLTEIGKATGDVTVTLNKSYSGEGGTISTSHNVTIATGANTLTFTTALTVTQVGKLTLKGNIGAQGGITLADGELIVDATDPTSKLTVTGGINVTGGTLTFKGATVTADITLTVTDKQVTLTQTKGTGTFTCNKLTLGITKENAEKLTVTLETAPTAIAIEGDSHTTCNDLANHVTIAGEAISHSYSEGKCTICGAGEVEKEGNITLDFVKHYNTFASAWTTSYKDHQLTESDFSANEPKFTLTIDANKQNSGQSIDDRPVTKTKKITLQLLDAYHLTGKIKFEFKQWGSKTLGTLTLTVTTSAGEQKIEGNTDFSQEFNLSKYSNVSKVVLSSDDSNNQAGITAITFSYTSGNTSGSGETPTPSLHECTSKCETCGKCTNKECQDPVCADKCPGHTTPEPTGTVYKRITSVDELMSGAKYLIVYEKSATEAYIFSCVDSTSNYVTATIADGQIIQTDAIAKYEIEITDTTNSYSLKVVSNSNYFNYNSNSNGLSFGESGVSNKITFEKEGSVNIVNEKGAHIRFNKDPAQSRFRYFKSSSYTTQQAIYLYILAG